MPGMVVAGLVVASLGSLLAVLQLGAVVLIAAVFALAAPDLAVAVGYPATWLIATAAGIASLVLVLRRRGWARIVLAALAVLSAMVAVTADQPPIGPALMLVGVVLLSVPSAQRWFASGTTARRPPGRAPDDLHADPRS